MLLRGCASLHEYEGIYERCSHEQSHDGPERQS